MIWPKPHNKPWARSHPAAGCPNGTDRPSQSFLSGTEMGMSEGQLLAWGSGGRLFQVAPLPTQPQARVFPVQSEVCRLGWLRCCKPSHGVLGSFWPRRGDKDPPPPLLTGFLLKVIFKHLLIMYCVPGAPRHGMFAAEKR